ncbi:MAG TPA: exosortase system-associated protein, TIGR04073 family [Candidatus Omnitrophota bacterium]|nr:exosortase system-associated protein, TIGR04073 family [Candidatus Omnitrophota bacterium]
MVKKITSLVMIAVMVSSVAFATEVTNGPVKKLGRGVSNIGTCFLEIPDGMMKANDEGGPMAGCTWGLFQGVIGTVKRAVVGVYETVTFPIPAPANYAPILKDPEFFMNEDPVLFRND